MLGTQPPPVDGVNSFAAVQERASAGTIGWTGPILLLGARTVLLLVCQSSLALVFYLCGKPSPLQAAGQWWVVYGTAVDAGCLIGLRFFLRREGLQLRNLLGPVRMRYGRDLWLGLGLYALIFPFFLGASIAARLLIYGSDSAALTHYLFHAHRLPLWATIYSLAVWWVIWSPTEEATYQAYVMPRLRALTNRPWAAFVMVMFFFALQHSMLPFFPDWRYLLFRFVMFLPGCALLIAAYLRLRRLAPLIVAHWPMDISAALMTLLW